MTCMCGKGKPPGQTYCFNCWLNLPASICYRLLDEDSGRRALAHIDAEAYIRSQTPSSAMPKRHRFLPQDRKTASTGEHS